MEFGFSITALGAALNAKLLAGSTLSISKVMVGSGKATAGTDLTTMTALITPVALATSNTPAVGANNTVSIIVEYRNDLNGGLKEGFWINEVGLFATDPDAGEILYAYATLGDYPQHIRPYAADAIMVRRFVMEFAMKAGVTVSITYSADAAITAAEAATLIADHNANATAHQNLKISFTEATQRANIYDGLSLAACLGRIKKWFADMKSAAFCESADFAGATHAAQHATGGADAITPEAIGAAKVNHNHSAADVGADPSGAAAAVQANLAAHTARADNPHGVTAVQIGAVSWKNHDAGISATDMNNANYPNAYESAIADGTLIGLPTGWWHIKYFRHGDNNGFGAQIAIGLTCGNQMYFRTSNGTVWYSWNSLNAEPLLRLNTGLGNEYLWKRYLPSRAPVVAVTANVDILMAGSSYTYSIKRSTSINPITGAMVNPVVETFSNGNNEAVIYNVAGMYWSWANYNATPADVPQYYTDTGASITVVWTPGYGNNYSIPSHRLTFLDQESNVSYVNSPNPNAYPISDGFSYANCGAVGAKANIQIVEYAGTGTYGQSTPNLLVCPFMPKFMMVYPLNAHDPIGPFVKSVYGGFSWVLGQQSAAVVGTTTSGAANDSIVRISKTDKTVSWYSSDAHAQQNDATLIYRAIIIG